MDVKKFCYIAIYSFFALWINFPVLIAMAQSPQENGIFAIAKEYYDKGKIHEARILFRKALSDYPNNSLGHYFYGMSLESDLSSRKEAIEEFSKAYSLAPDKEHGLRAYAAAELLRDQLRREELVAAEQSRRQAEANAANLRAKQEQQSIREEQDRKRFDEQNTQLQIRKSAIFRYIAKGPDVYVAWKLRCPESKLDQYGRSELCPPPGEGHTCAYISHNGCSLNSAADVECKNLSIVYRSSDPSRNDIPYPSKTSWAGDMENLVLNIVPVEKNVKTFSYILKNGQLNLNISKDTYWLQNVKIISIQTPCNARSVF